MNRKECPNCGSYDTERVHIEWFTDTVETVRICNDCPAEYEVKFGYIAEKSLTEMGKEMVE